MSTTIHPIPATFWVVGDERKEANASRARDRGLEPCEFCGRGVAVGRGWQVVVTDGGASFLAIEAYKADPDLAERDRGFMGWWTVGPECGKDIPAAFRERNV